MRVKDLITRLLDEDMNAEVKLATQSYYEDKEGRMEVAELSFDIDKVEHWNYSAWLRFTDWRQSDDKERNN